jgi:hypothetical protein
MSRNFSSLFTYLVSCLAIFVFTGFLASCGGGSSSTPTPIPPPATGQFTHVYVVFPPASGVNNQHFMSTVMNQAAINGVTVAVSWNQAETSTPGTTTCTPVGTDICQKDAAGLYHTYNWSTVDANNAQWFSAQSGSKKVNIILNGIGGAAPNCALTNSCINPLTPYYVTSSTWVAEMAALGATTQDVLNGNIDNGCTNDVGLNTTSMTRDSTGLVTVTENNHGYMNGDIIWVGGTTPSDYNVTAPGGVPVQNATTNTFQYQSGTNTAGSATTPGTVISRQQSYPVPYETPYVTAWEAFIAAAIYHFNQSPNLSQIDYMRVGRSVGGEAYPFCVPDMEALPAPNAYTKSGWLAYYTAIDAFVAAQKPTMQILDPLNQEGTGNSGDPIDQTYGSSEAGIAVMYQNASGSVNGFGSQGMQASDITNYAAGNDCSSDWCAMFNNYYQSNDNLELQQLGLSAPVTVAGVNSATGDLRPLLPFAVSRHMTILELYNLDALLAYDPNYCVLPLVNGSCGSGSVEIPTIQLPATVPPVYFQAVGQPGQTGATGDGSYATTINQTEGQH